MDRDNPPIEPGPEPDTTDAGEPDDTDERHGTAGQTPVVDSEGNVGSAPTA
ncbi:hypothetical protein ACIGCK_01775 [Microbacterium sp. NPDC078428]|uniref:Uncharacterized protein n=1 Tax=Microbacterium limosum TaxID=3079935 RepID=A0AAU0MHQ4_9MICO|nr:hypothetical protein [Microbacterium sp. Y20]WOQ69997.1 hypothetical protein RYJ27_01835 [Microbacterium sp. Y20]